jgi:hypothetical protein
MSCGGPSRSCDPSRRPVRCRAGAGRLTTAPAVGRPVTTAANPRHETRPGQARTRSGTTAACREVPAWSARRGDPSRRCCPDESSHQRTRSPAPRRPQRPGHQVRPEIRPPAPATHRPHTAGVVLPAPGALSPCRVGPRIGSCSRSPSRTSRGPAGPRAGDVPWAVVCGHETAAKRSLSAPPRPAPRSPARATSAHQRPQSTAESPCRTAAVPAQRLRAAATSARHGSRAHGCAQWRRFHWSRHETMTAGRLDQALRLPPGPRQVGGGRLRISGHWGDAPELGCSVRRRASVHPAASPESPAGTASSDAGATRSARNPAAALPPAMATRFVLTSRA